MLVDIYGDRNRAMSLEQVWSRMIEEVAELVEPMEKEKIREIENGIPDLFAWLLAYTSKSDVNLQTLTWQKFERGCPGCGQARDCTCGLRENHRTKPSKRDLAVDSYRREPSTLDEWQGFFRELYGLTNEQQRPLSLLTKLTQDIGGVARLLRKRAGVDEVNWKVASVFAWLLAICNRYSATGTGEFKLSELVWKKYESRCPACTQRPCKCVLLGSIFIGYNSELEADMIEIKRIATEEFGLKVFVFPDLGPDFSRSGRMPAAFDAIASADAAIILLGSRFSPRVYAETVEIMHAKFREYIFPYAKESPDRDPESVSLISELRMVHRCISFRNTAELVDLARRDLRNAREVSQRLAA